MTYSEPLEELYAETHAKWDELRQAVHSYLIIQDHGCSCDECQMLVRISRSKLWKLTAHADKAGMPATYGFTAIPKVHGHTQASRPYPKEGAG